MPESSKITSIPDLPAGYNIRPIEPKDNTNGALETLACLTTVGEVTDESFKELLAYWNSLPQIYKVMVITDDSGVVVSIGSLIIERKIIHGVSKVGHIEDIAVNPKQQGKKLGLIMIKNLLRLGESEGCYKVILDCDESNVGFYEKCGLHRAGVEMDFRF